MRTNQIEITMNCSLSNYEEKSRSVSELIRDMTPLFITQQRWISEFFLLETINESACFCMR